MNIGVVGLGRVGLPLALVFAKQFDVYGVDINKERLSDIKNGKQFFEPNVNSYLEKFGAKLNVSNDYSILQKCGVVFVITHTPSLPSGLFNLQFVEDAVRELHKINKDCLIVVSSTINVGDLAKLKQTHLKITYNPCMIKQGSIIKDFENPKYIMIGSYTKQDFEVVKEVWQSVASGSVQFYSFLPEELEVAKLCLNVWLSTQITVANVIGELCKSIGVEPQKTLEMLGKDVRNYSSGLGFMGPCLPRDVNCFKSACIEHFVGSGHTFANVLNDLNNYTVHKYVKKIESYGFRRVGMLGVAYKVGVSYLDESQPIKIAKKLLSDGYEVFVYDKLAEENARKELMGKVCFCSSENECIEKSDIIFVGTSNFKGVEAKGKIVLNPWR